METIIFVLIINYKQMIQVEFLQEIIGQQRLSIISRDAGMIREQLQSLPDLISHALIVSGIRRCGKSTLLSQLLRDRYPNSLYLNIV